MTASLRNSCLRNRQGAWLRSVTFSLRPLADPDVADLVELSLVAWEPVYASMRDALGGEVFDGLYPDWRATQGEAVRDACTNPEVQVVVAEVGGAPVGFAAFVADTASGLGVVDMVAVHPSHQRDGIGTALTGHAFDALRTAGMRVAMVETGGDPGHAPARRTYARAGATAYPVARFFKAL